MARAWGALWRSWCVVLHLGVVGSRGSLAELWTGGYDDRCMRAKRVGSTSADRLSQVCAFDDRSFDISLQRIDRQSLLAAVMSICICI